MYSRPGERPSRVKVRNSEVTLTCPRAVTVSNICQGEAASCERDQVVGGEGKNTTEDQRTFMFLYQVNIYKLQIMHKLSNTGGGKVYHLFRVNGSI